MLKLMKAMYGIKEMSIITVNEVRDVMGGQYQLAAIPSIDRIVITGRHVAIICRYNKMGSLTGHDKFVSHVIDGITRDLIIQSLTPAHH